MLRDFDAIRSIAPRGARIYVTTEGRKKELVSSFGARAALSVYLSGYVRNHRGTRFHEGVDYRPDFVLSRERVDSPFLLTPGNGTVFLYDGAAWCKAAAGESRPNPARVVTDGSLEFPCGK